MGVPERAAVILTRTLALTRTLVGGTVMLRGTAEAVADDFRRSRGKADGGNRDRCDKAEDEQGHPDLPRRGH